MYLQGTPNSEIGDTKIRDFSRDEVKMRKVFQDFVFNFYKLNQKELVSRSRKQRIVKPRQVAIYLARRYTDQPLQAIGKSFNRYHATAMHAVNTIERGIKQEVITRNHIDYLSKQLESNKF